MIKTLLTTATLALTVALTVALAAPLPVHADHHGEAADAVQPKPSYSLAVAGMT